MSRLGDHGMKFRPVRPVRPFPSPKRTGGPIPGPASGPSPSAGPSMGNTARPAAGRPAFRPPPPRPTASSSAPNPGSPAPSAPLGRPIRPPEVSQLPSTPPETQGVKSTVSAFDERVRASEEDEDEDEGPARRRARQVGEADMSPRMTRREEPAERMGPPESPPATAPARHNPPLAPITLPATSAPLSPPQTAPEPVPGPISTTTVTSETPEPSSPARSASPIKQAPSPSTPSGPSNKQLNTLQDGDGGTADVSNTGANDQGMTIDPSLAPISVPSGGIRGWEEEALPTSSSTASFRTAQSAQSGGAEAVGTRMRASRRSVSTPAGEAEGQVGLGIVQGGSKGKPKAGGKGRGKASTSATKGKKGTALFMTSPSDEEQDENRDPIGGGQDDGEQADAGEDPDQAGPSRGKRGKKVPAPKKSRQKRSKKTAGNDAQEREGSPDPERALMDEEAGLNDENNDGDEEDDAGPARRNKRKRSTTRTVYETKEAIAKRPRVQPKKHGMEALFGKDRLPPDAEPGIQTGPFLDAEKVTMGQISRDPGHGKVSRRGVELQKKLDERDVALEKEMARRRQRVRARDMARENGDGVVDPDEPIDEDLNVEMEDVNEERGEASPERVKKDDRGSIAPAPPPTEPEPPANKEDVDEEDEYDFTNDGGGQGGPAVLMALDANGEWIVDATTTTHDARALARDADGLHGEGDEVEELNDDLTFVNSASYAKRKKSARWDKEQEGELVRRLMQYGESLDILGFFFKERTPRELRVRINKILDRDPDLARVTMRVRPTAEDYLELERMTGFSLSTPPADHPVLHVDESVDPIPSGTATARARAERARSERAASVASGRSKKGRGKKGGMDGLEVMDTEEMPED